MERIHYKERKEQKDQMEVRRSHDNQDTQDRRLRPERFREQRQGKTHEEIVPAMGPELWRARQIMVDLKSQATPSEIHDCLHLISYWDDTHPWLLKASTTDHQKEQLASLYSQATIHYRTYENTLYSDASATQFKDTAEAYTKQYFDMIDKNRILLAGVDDVSKLKPLGHLHKDEIERVGTTPEALLEKYRNDPKTRVFYGESGYLGAPGLFRYHPEGLQKLLHEHASTIEGAGWPTAPDEFAHRAAQEIVPHRTPLADVLSFAYGLHINEHGFRSLSTMDALVKKVNAR